MTRRRTGRDSEGGPRPHALRFAERLTIRPADAAPPEPVPVPGVPAWDRVLALMDQVEQALALAGQGGEIPARRKEAETLRALGEAVVRLVVSGGGKGLPADLVREAERIISLRSGAGDSKRCARSTPSPDATVVRTQGGGASAGKT